MGAWGADVTEQMDLCGCSSTFPRLLADGTEVPLHVSPADGSEIAASF